MTVQELIVLVYEEIGEDSDLCPYTTIDNPTTFDISTSGAQKILGYLNRALQRIAHWRFRDGSLLRFRGLMKQVYLTAKDSFETDITESSSTTVTVNGLDPDADNEFTGWIIEITNGPGVGQKRIITSGALIRSEITLTVHKQWDTIPVLGNTCKLYKNFFDMLASSTLPFHQYHFIIDPINSISDIIKIRDIETGDDLERGDYTDMFSANVLVDGIPSQYKVYGNRIIFDVALKSRRTYEILYIANPAVLSTASQLPGIPIAYHEVLAQWATFRLRKRNQDFAGSYAEKRDIIDAMEALRREGEFDTELESGGMVVWG